MRRLHRRTDPRRLPQAFPPQLRRLRRAPVLRGGPRPPPPADGRCHGRDHDLRGRLAARPPATDLALAGAQLIVNLSASPFHVGKAEEREEMLVTRARDTSSFFAFCNLVGGQDELVFDGHSVVLDDAGEVLARASGFDETTFYVDLDP